MWIKNFFNELKAWSIVRKVYKKNRKEFDKLRVRSDWFGQLYTVINRDPDVTLGSDLDEAYLHNDLAKIWSLFTKLNIVDILAYEMKPFEEKTELENNKVEIAQGYYITFTPAWNLDRQYVTWKSVLFMTLFTIAIITGIVFLVLHFI